MALCPFLDYLNEEGELPFLKFGMGGFLKDDEANGVQWDYADVDSDSSDLKSLIRDLIKAIKEGDDEIVEAILEQEPSVDVSVYTDMSGEVEAQVSAFESRLKDRSRRGRPLFD